MSQNALTSDALMGLCEEIGDGSALLSSTGDLSIELMSGSAKRISINYCSTNIILKASAYPFVALHP